MKLIHRKVQEIEDPDFKALIVELEFYLSFPINRDQWILHALTQVVYPWDANRKKIAKNLINPEGLLSSKVRKIQSSVLLQIFEELAQLHGESAELYHNTTLYVFFNKVLPDFEKKKTPYKFDHRDIGRR